MRVPLRLRLDRGEQLRLCFFRREAGSRLQGLAALRVQVDRPLLKGGPLRGDRQLEVVHLVPPVLEVPLLHVEPLLPVGDAVLAAFEILALGVTPALAAALTDEQGDEDADGEQLDHG